MIRGTIWSVAVKGNVVFLAETSKFIFMPIRMEFNLMRENTNEENIS
jgi:hypothetical protein